MTLAHVPYGTPIKFFNQEPWLLTNPLDLFFVYSLRELGYRVEVVTRIVPMDKGLYFITFASPTNLPQNYILYNFEYSDQYLRNPAVVYMFNHALAVWDYSTRNITKLGLPVPHHFVPYLPGDYPSIVAGMKAFVSPVKNHEYLFYGCMNDKRRLALDATGLAPFEVGPCCRDQSKVCGPQLFELVGASQCVVNVHYYDDPVLEVYRITECMLLGTKVLSEPGYVDEVYLTRLTNLSILPDAPPSKPSTSETLIDETPVDETPVSKAVQSATAQLSYADLRNETDELLSVSIAINRAKRPNPCAKCREYEKNPLRSTGKPPPHNCWKYS